MDNLCKGVRPKPRLHPVIHLVAKEWVRAGRTQTDPDFDAFTIEKVTEQCKRRSEEHPEWNVGLNMLDLDTRLENQEYVAWWIPGDKSWEDEEEEQAAEEERASEEAGEDPGASHMCLILCVELNNSDIVRLYSSGGGRRCPRCVTYASTIACETDRFECCQVQVLRKRPEMIAMHWTMPWTMTTTVVRPHESPGGRVRLSGRPPRNWMRSLCHNVHGGPAVLDHRFVHHIVSLAPVTQHLYF